jgi:hypothetical protein
MAVLRASDEKGEALERYVAGPAWEPLLSLESVDGPLYHSMIADFHRLTQALPPPAAFADVCRRRVSALAARLASESTDRSPGESQPAGAEAVAQLCVACFLEHLFGEDDGQLRDALAAASWEWRREIAVRGRAYAQVKARAVELALQKLRQTPALWRLFGERWREPRFISLLLQPFLISPAINVTDIAVAMKRHPGLSLEDALRKMHPFPILERFLREDVLVDGRVAVRANTQAVLFTSDFCDAAWPPFGAGPRACAGTAMAMALLRPMLTELVPLQRFQPETGHRFSGRHNDGTLTLAEALYFARTVGGVVLGAGRRGGLAGEAAAKLQGAS